MPTYLPTIAILLGLTSIVAAQFGIALRAFTGNPLRGVLCFILPFYVYVYARKYEANPWFMRIWYLGFVLLVAGGVLAS